MTTQSCARCGLAAPDQASDEFVDWEALNETEVICSDCVTPTEEKLTLEDYGDFADAMVSTGLPDCEHVREKIRENRLRRAALRQGLLLQKARRRDTRAYDYGTYQIVDVHTNCLVAYSLPHGFGMSLDDVQEWLTAA